MGQAKAFVGMEEVVEVGEEDAPGQAAEEALGDAGPVDGRSQQQLQLGPCEALVVAELLGSRIPTLQETGQLKEKPEAWGDWPLNDSSEPQLKEKPEAWGN